MATGGMQAAIEPFSGKNWSSWIQRLTFYFVANDVCDEQKKRALLLTLCGTDTFETACALVAPKTPGQVGYADIVALLQKHFDPRPSELYSQYVFQRRDQRPEESISNYVAALRSLSADCNFGVPATTSATSTPPAEGHAAVLANPTMLPQDVMLRDRFMCGIRDEHLQQRLFAEKDLTFQRALDLARCRPKVRRSSNEDLRERRAPRRSPNQEIQEVLARHPEVFKEGIDGYVGPLVHLDLEEGATPIFCKARSVPLAYEEPIEEELDRLQKQGILEPTQHSEMATPLVWVRKKDGTFRVCGDYRSTVNAVVKKTAYPLPTTAEVFAKLRGGTTFSTLDLYQAYQQLRVDDETAALLTVNTTKGLFKDAFGREAAIAFASRTLGTAEKNYSQLDKEGLAVVYGISHFHQYVAGRHVTVLTDHQPLLGIMGEKKQIPQVLSPRMTRWCLKLATYDYDLVYRPGRLHQNADALSRLPLPAQVDEPCSPGDVLMLASTPRFELSPRQLAELTRNDPLLSRVMTAVSNGELRRLPKQEFSAFAKLGHELSLQEGCVIWGARLVVPEKARKDVLDLAHAGHRGVVAMKACARGYFWWPGVDNDIERVVKSCATCCQHQKTPTKAPAPEWKRPTTPWHTIHADFAGPVEGRMLLIVVDAYSKWLEVCTMRNIQSPTLIEELRNLFATFGIPERVVTDNGPSFVSAEMEEFLKKNRVTHITSAAYHPATNGEAERMVYETKQALAKDQSGTFACRLARFQVKQHTTISVTTGKTPAALMFGRELSTALTRIQQRPAERVTTDHSVTRLPRKVAIGQSVFFRNFAGNPAWVGGTVLKRLGHRPWLIKSRSGTVRRHLDHIKPGAEAHPTEDSPRNDQTNGPVASDQQDTVPAPYVISPPAEAPPPHDPPTTPDSEHREAEAGLDTCATQARDDQPSGSAQHQSAPRPQRDRRPPDRYGDPD
ncbi:uncharacterized protein K02A2.6-like [Rhipicephalus sanguineus]|uniref:uncharacterized protein K02A2.6-like n=1 Tax=Rhipicephalus sanguineus TaxID=34632 RepID=UPI001894C1CB|nr:uncharacterized protein K02A2.6-like [Rhipicephalus sanguineus]